MEKYVEKLNAECIEWQKGGLPHSHILVWLKHKIHASQIDSFLSAEIPNKLIYPELYEIIIRQMIHGTCGRMNMNSPCMKNGKCTKHFSK